MEEQRDESETDETTGDATGDATGEASPGGLPIADYDHLPKLAVEGRARSLDVAELEILLRYESAHRGRTPVIRMLAGRLRQLRGHDDAAPPQGGYGPAPSAPRPAYP